MKDTSLTAKQRATLQYIQDYINHFEYPPTLREIAGHFGVSWKAISDRLLMMEKKGYIQRSPYRARAVKILKGV